jgi:hypothetical protein
MIQAGPCMCRGVVADWDDWEFYPFCPQTTMHSPVGCIRRPLRDWDLHRIYYELTGWRLPGAMERAVLFQAVIMQLKLHPESASKYNAVLTPVPTNSTVYDNDGAPINGGNTTPRVPVPRRIKTPTAPKKKEAVIVVNPGPIKPPWVR